MQESAGKRVELADFLRTRRARLTPADVSLPESARRRTPGLRREDVAQLVGISSTWYTWLEQGRNIRVSIETLERVAQVLRLGWDERMHLFSLAHRSPPPVPPPLTETVSPEVQRMIETLDECPAHVKGRRWDVLAWNQADRAVFCDYEALPPAERNMLWIMFTNPRYRRLLVDWERETAHVLAQFRADCGRYIGDPWFVELIDKLQAISPEFRQWWRRHDVLGRPAGPKELNHPIVGRLVLEPTVFQLADSPDLKLIIHTPLPEADSGRKIRNLLINKAQVRSAKT